MVFKYIKLEEDGTFNRDKTNDETIQLEIAYQLKRIADQFEKYEAEDIEIPIQY